MSRLDGALRHGMRHQEEVKLTVDHLCLLHEASVDIGALWWVIDEHVIRVVVGDLLEEPLSDTFVHNDECDFRMLLAWGVLITTVLHLNDAVKLSQLLVDDLLSHGVTDTVTVDEDVTWHGTIVKLTVALESTLEVV